MKQREQKRFVTELTKAVTAEIVEDIAGGKVPESWDGIELRKLLADRFARAMFNGVLSGERLRDYNNTILINDL